MPYKDIEKRKAWEKRYKKRKAYLHKIWAIKNKDKRNKYRRELYEKNPDLKVKNMISLRIRRKTTPWLCHYDDARTRCLNKNRSTYPRYGGRGIKFLLTHKTIKKLWFRDKAFNLKKPSLDRIDNDKDYNFSNCRFIEHSQNCTKGNYEARWPR